MGLGGTSGVIVLLVALGGPLMLGLAGFALARGPASPAGHRDWRLAAQSGLLYTLAFNLTFFIQELFLVVPKALTPGLRPILYHNNHDWDGSHPLENLFQGTGALAILISGLVFALLVRRGTGRTPAFRLFFIWMAYHGLFQALPQVATNLLSPGSDVSRAMDYFEMGTPARTAAGFCALALMIVAGLRLTRPLLGLAERDSQIARPGARSRFIFNAATLPALAAIPLIILFRIPRETLEVVLPPIAVTIVGISWIQANAWRVAGVSPAGPSGNRALLGPAVAVLALLVVFQLVLRPGIPFY